MKSFAPFLLVFVTVMLLAQNQVLADANDYAKVIQEALTLAASEMRITEDEVLAEWELQAKPIGTDFDCVQFSKPSTSPPHSVHQLSPYDVNVVGALGDSVTAAMGAGANCLITDIIEYRGLSWSIGGDKDLSKVTTLPNILKQYNPDIKGFSIKTGGKSSPNSKFNVAASGATSHGIEKQAEKLITKMKSDKAVDFANDWKMVTLWIGGNDLCAYCKDRDKYSPATYVQNIQDTLDLLHHEMPRTFVNLVQILDVGRLAAIRGLVCDIVHAATCSCASSARDEVAQAATDYQEKISQLIDSGRYDTRDDFTVVVQPFMIGVNVPSLPNGKPDKSYLAPDCFHFSAKGHREGAVGLWNNMLERVGSKSSDWKPGEDLNCPTSANPYFFTSKNSITRSLTAQSSDSGDVSVLSEDQPAPGGSSVGMVATIIVAVVIFALVAVVAVILVVCQLKKRSSISGTTSLTLAGEKLPLLDSKL